MDAPTRCPARPIWRLGPDGRADSLPGGTAAFVIGSVIPDTVRQPEPKAAIAPIRSERRTPRAAAFAAVLSAGLLAAGVRWRRRRPRPPALPPHVPVEPEVPDARWLAAGEPKAVAARAVLQLRVAIAHTVPGANLALSTTECLAVVERARPDAPLRELRAVVEQLDRVEFASGHGPDVAASGPRLGSARIEARSEGISIVLCVDLSSSMLAEDFAPANRIDVAKATAIDFVRARRSDRIGLVAFAAQALTQVPLTTDYAVLEAALQGLRIGMLEDGTAIGTAIATAANRLRRAPGKSKVIVLLTDGVNNRGTVDPRTAAQAAEAFGIRIYTIGVGTRGQAPVPMGQGLEGLRYQMMPVEIDEPLLTEIASTSGGRYFRATDTGSPRHIFQGINRLEKSSVVQVVYRRFDEAYH